MKQEPKQEPLVNLSGDTPFGWEVLVNWHVEGSEIKFNATVRVSSWVALSEDFEQMEDAKMEGCAMMAAMSAELEERLHA